MPSGYCKERGRTGGLRSIRLTSPSSRHPSHVKQVSVTSIVIVVVCTWRSGRQEWIVWAPCIIIIKFVSSSNPGPGVPSGHSQAAAVILWCLTDVLRSARPSLSLGLWAVFIAGQVNIRGPLNCRQLTVTSPQVLMWTSRLYISAHFPHQCLMGFVVGLLAVRYHQCYLCHFITLLA